MTFDRANIAKLRASYTARIDTIILHCCLLSTSLSSFSSCDFAVRYGVCDCSSMASRGEFDVGRTAIDAEVSVIVHLKNLDRCIRVACVCLLPFLLVTHHIFLIVAFFDRGFFDQYMFTPFSFLHSPIASFPNSYCVLSPWSLHLPPFYHTTTLSPVLRCDCPYRN